MRKNEIMNNFITQGNQIVSFVLIVILLQACSSTPGHKYQSEETRQNLEELIKQAQQAPQSKKGPLLIQAAGLLVLEGRYEKSQELLIHVDQQRLTTLQMDDFWLYYGETLLALEANEASLNQLRSIAQISSKPVKWQIRYAQSLSDSYLANNNYFEAAKLRIGLEDLISAPEALAENNEKIWFALDQIETSFFPQLISDFNSRRVNGWLEIVQINKRWGYHPEKLVSKIDLWKKRYPLHPSTVNQPETLKKLAKAVEFKPSRIAVLLPLTGKLASIGQMVHDGIIAAHYQAQRASSAPLLSFYDTARSLSALTPYQQALKDGADFIVGPLTKENIDTILNQESLPTPLLALNRLDEQKYSHSEVFQFGLPIEDEAVQAAQHAFDKGYRKSVAFLPDNATGARAHKAFKTHFEQLGGELITVQTYKEAKLIKNNVQHMLGVDSSLRRKRSLQQLLGRNLEFDMRRRQDTDFIFLVASPGMGRRIKPFINYYFAHDLPVIATSSIFEGKRNPKTDLDLNGIEFPDIPLLLSQRPEYQQTRKAIAKSVPEALSARGRFFALGFDGYKILTQLSILQSFPEYRWTGLAGELGVDGEGLVHRYLTWAMFNKGIPHVTKERITKEPAKNKNQLSVSRAAGKTNYPSR